eukprot:361399-Chlamydomonas_euryale.AAC.2
MTMRTAGTDGLRALRQNLPSSSWVWQRSRVAATAMATTAAMGGEVGAGARAEAAMLHARSTYGRSRAKWVPARQQHASGARRRRWSFWQRRCVGFWRVSGGIAGASGGADAWFSAVSPGSLATQVRESLAAALESLAARLWFPGGAGVGSWCHGVWAPGAMGCGILEPWVWVWVWDPGAVGCGILTPWGVGSWRHGVWDPGAVGVGSWRRGVWDPGAVGCGILEPWVWDPGAAGCGFLAPWGVGSWRHGVWAPGAMGCGLLAPWGVGSCCHGVRAPGAMGCGIWAPWGVGSWRRWHGLLAARVGCWR